MKSLTISRFISKALIFAACFLIVINSLQINAPDKKSLELIKPRDNRISNSKKIQIVQEFTGNNTASSNNTDNSTNLISPEIDLNRQIIGNPKSQYESVSYVKDISLAGHAALEIQKSGE